MMAEQWKPTARRDDLVISQLDGEVVVYDLASDKAHCLNESAVALWQACEGDLNVEQLAALVDPPDVDLVWFGLHQLAAEGLLETQIPRSAPGRGVSRRQMLRRLGVAGAAAFAVPTVISIIAPTAAAAVTCRTLGQSCTGGASCEQNSVVGTCCANLRCCGATPSRMICVANVTN